MGGRRPPGRRLGRKDIQWKDGTLKLNNKPWKGMRISSSSDRWIEGKNMLGVIIYDIGTTPYHRNIYPGYMIWYYSDNLKNDPKGSWHSRVIRKFFGREHSDLINYYDAQFGGAAYKNGKFYFRSSTFNKDSSYQGNQAAKQNYDTSRNMAKLEECIVNQFLLDWTTTGYGRPAYTNKNLEGYITETQECRVVATGY